MKMTNLSLNEILRAGAVGNGLLRSRVASYSTSTQTQTKNKQTIVANMAPLYRVYVRASMQFTTLTNLFNTLTLTAA